MSKKPNEISVIIPSYKPNLDTLAECLKAICDSDFKPKEIILVDDGSFMEYPEEIRTCCRIIRNIKNMGPAYAKNAGAKEGKSDILCFIDADVKVGRDALTKIIGKFSDPDVAAVQTIYSKFTPVRNFFSEYQTLYQHYNFQTIRSDYLCTFGSYAIAIRKDVFFKTGGFDERIKRPSVEDEHLGAVLYSKGYNILLAKDVEVEHMADYNMVKLLKRMFIMGEENVKYFVMQPALKKMKLSKTHHSLNLIASVLIAPLSMVFLIVAAAIPLTGILAAMFIAVFLLVNAGFLMFLYRNRGAVFTLKSVIAYYFVSISSFLGCLKGVIDGLAKCATPYVKDGIEKSI